MQPGDEAREEDRRAVPTRSDAALAGNAMMPPATDASVATRPIVAVE